MATPTVQNVRAAPPPLLPPPLSSSRPPPGAEDVYAPAAASLSSRGSGAALFLSCSRCRRRRSHYCRHTLSTYPWLLPIGARSLSLNIPVN